MRHLAPCLLVASLVSPWAWAKDEPAACLRTRIWDTYTDGWAIRTSADTSVAFGRTKFYKVSLLKGRAYRVLSCADEAATNLDILLYDKDGAVLARDDSTTAQPTLAYTPERSGVYFVVLYLRDATERTAEIDASWALIHHDG